MENFVLLTEIFIHIIRHSNQFLFEYLPEENCVSDIVLWTSNSIDFLSSFYCVDEGSKSLKVLFNLFFSRNYLLYYEKSISPHEFIKEKFVPHDDYDCNFLASSSFRYSFEISFGLIITNINIVVTNSLK